jgi:hypothetical protein
MKITDLKKEKQSKYDALLKDCGVFFAFSEKQFNEGKTPLTEGDKYISMGAGGYMPKSKVQDFLKGSKNINVWYKQSIKNNKLREAHILHELSNHEAWYVNDIGTTLIALGEGYTREEVLAVFNEHFLEYNG